MPCDIDVQDVSMIGGQYSVLRIDDTWHPAEVRIA